METLKKADKIFKVKRRKSEPIPHSNYDSDEEANELIDYNGKVSYGWNHEDQVPAPVQLKRPSRSNLRRPGDKLHLAVWDNDPAKAQKLVMEGTY